MGEREAVQTHTFAIFPVFHLSLTKMTEGWKNAAGAPSVRFLVDFKCFRLTVALPAYRIMELSWNKAFDNKERENKNNFAFSTSSGLKIW